MCIRDSSGSATSRLRLALHHHLVEEAVAVVRSVRAVQHDITGEPWIPGGGKPGIPAKRRQPQAARGSGDRAARVKHGKVA
eukprot:9071547-Pyramimonas_sp.AAC.1